MRSDATLPQDSTPQPGDVLNDLLVTDLTVEGKAVARHQGRVVFLDRGLLGARLRAKVSGVKKGVLLAHVVEELQTSPHQISPWCPHFTDCGACLWQHLSPQATLEWKQRHVQETLSRIGAAGPIPVEFPAPSPLQRYFRNKMSFAFGCAADGVTQLGLRRYHDHAIVEVTQCGLQAPPAMELLEYVRARVNELGLEAFSGESGDASDIPEVKGAKKKKQNRGYLRFLLLRTGARASASENTIALPHDATGDTTRSLLVECITGPAHDGRTAKGNGLTNAQAVALLGQELLSRFSLTGFVHSERARNSNLAQGEKSIAVLGEKFFYEQYGECVLRVPYNVFLQTNTAAAHRLYSLIRQEAGLTGGETLWDLYCGVGAIALFLADSLKEAHGCEIHKESVQAARDNASRLGLSHCHFYAGPVNASCLQSLPPPDLIIADPPRAGLGAECAQALCAVSAKKLLYVSCDIATQARDLAMLSPRWQAVKSLPVDMFPYTPHVENLLIFERKES